MLQFLSIAGNLKDTNIIKFKIKLIENLKLKNCLEFQFIIAKIFIDDGDSPNTHSNALLCLSNCSVKNILSESWFTLTCHDVRYCSSESKILYKILYKKKISLQKISLDFLNNNFTEKLIIFEYQCVFELKNRQLRII